MPNGQQSGFDVNAARQAGYSDDDILSHLTRTRNFDVNSALQSGYSKADVINFLATAKPGGQQGADPYAVLSKAETISAQPKSSGIFNTAENWLRQAGSDVRYGSGQTVLGRTLKRMGAPGTSMGVPESVGEFIGSPVLGTLQAAQGAAELPQSGKRWQGTKDVVGGALQAATIPSAFMGGPAAEAGATRAARGAGKIFGDAERAGQLFDKVRTVTGGARVEVTDEMSQAASRILELSERGAKGMPRVISRFVQRVTNPNLPDISYNEARDFYSNVSRLSANEYSNMNPQMARMVGDFAHSFKDAIQATADAAGVGDKLSEAMQLYAKSKAWQKFGAKAWAVSGRIAERAVADAIGVGAPAYMIYRGLRSNR